MVARFSELKKYGFVTEKDDDSVEIGKKFSRLRLLEEDGETSRDGFPGTGDWAVAYPDVCGMPSA